MADQYPQSEVDPQAVKVPFRRDWTDWLDGRTLVASSWTIEATGSTPETPVPSLSGGANDSTETSIIVDPPFPEGAIFLLTNHVRASSGGEENDATIAVIVTDS